MLNELVEKAHKNAVDKGFYEKTEDLIKSLSKTLDYKVKDNKVFDELMNNIISTRLMLIVSELGEALEALRNRNFCKIEKIPNIVETDNDIFLQFVKDTFEDEIADVFIRLFDLCGFMKIDIERHINLKMDYNSSRPKLHGKEF